MVFPRNASRETKFSYDAEIAAVLPMSGGQGYESALSALPRLIVSCMQVSLFGCIGFPLIDQCSVDCSIDPNGDDCDDIRAFVGLSRHARRNPCPEQLQGLTHVCEHFVPKSTFTLTCSSRRLGLAECKNSKLVSARGCHLQMLPCVLICTACAETIMSRSGKHGSPTSEEIGCTILRCRIRPT